MLNPEIQSGPWFRASTVYFPEIIFLSPQNLIKLHHYKIKKKTFFQLMFSTDEQYNCCRTFNFFKTFLNVCNNSPVEVTEVCTSPHFLQERVDQARHMHPCFCYVSCSTWRVVAQKLMPSNILPLHSQFSVPSDLPRQCQTLNLVEQ